MFTELIKAIDEKKLRLDQFSANTLAAIQEITNNSELGFTLSEVIPETSGAASEILSRTVIVTELLSGLKDTPAKKLPIIPKAWLQDIPQNVENVCAQLQDTINQINNVKGDGGFGSFNREKLLLNSKNGGQIWNIGGKFRDIDNTIDSALVSIYRVTNVTVPQKYDGAVQLLHPLADTMARMQNWKTSAEGALAEIQATVTKAKTAEEEVANFHAATAGEKTKAEEASKGAAAGKAQVDTLLVTIDQTRAKAEALNSSVDQFQPKFNDFDAKLAERNQTFTTGDQEFKELRDSLSKSEKEALGIIANSKVALGWGTASGLAANFEVSAKELEEPMNQAMRRFYWSIGAIVLLAILSFNAVPVLSAYVNFPSLAPEPNDTATTALLHVATGLTIRITMILPAVFLAIFFNHRYNRLFTAREQYILKKTVASAIPGFKEQAAPANADPYVKAMTAAAFERLLFNPNEEATKDLAMNDRGGLLSRWLVRLIRQAFEEAKKASDKAP